MLQRSGQGHGHPLPWFAERRFARIMLVPDWVRKNVFFIGMKKEGRFFPRATGFFVGWEEDQWTFVYMVTAEHVISMLMSGGYDIWARFNLKDGTAEEVKLPSDRWKFHPDEMTRTDVAVCAARVLNSGGDIDLNAIPLNGRLESVVSEEIRREQNVGLGDEIFVVGLFRSHHGAQRNVPIVRIGNISAMREEPVWTKYCGYIDAYLIEAQSIGGLSGSPVVFHMPPFRVIDANLRLSKGRQFYLLGLIHGHFDIQNLNQDVVTDSEARASQGINTGIGVVVPVERIVETVRDHPDIVDERRQIIAEKRKSGATPDITGESRQSADAEPPQ
jgi:hypothetical protein